MPPILQRCHPHWGPASSPSDTSWKATSSRLMSSTALLSCRQVPRFSFPHIGRLEKKLPIPRHYALYKQLYSMLSINQVRSIGMSVGTYCCLSCCMKIGSYEESCPFQRPFLLLVQEGWLSSSGRLFSNAADTVEVAFDRFWVDLGSTKLRHSGREGRIIFICLFCA